MTRRSVTHAQRDSHRTRLSGLQGHSHFAKHFLSFFGIQASPCSLFPEKNKIESQRGSLLPRDVLLSLRRKGTRSNVFSRVKNAASSPPEEQAWFCSMCEAPDVPKLQEEMKGTAPSRLAQWIASQRKATSPAPVCPSKEKGPLATSRDTQPNPSRLAQGLLRNTVFPES